jgi:hypothetical protein
MPAAMVLPMAAAMPNRTPRTCNKRPRLGTATPLAPPAPGLPMPVADASDVLDNGESQGTVAIFAMIVAP